MGRRAGNIRVSGRAKINPVFHIALQHITYWMAILAGTSFCSAARFLEPPGRVRGAILDGTVSSVPNFSIPVAAFRAPFATVFDARQTALRDESRSSSNPGPDEHRRI